MYLNGSLCSTIYIAGELDDLADVKEQVEREFCSLCVPDAQLFPADPDASGTVSSLPSAVVLPESVSSPVGESDNTDQTAYLRSALDENRRLKSLEAADAESEQKALDNEFSITTGPIPRM